MGGGGALHATRVSFLDLKVFGSVGHAAGVYADGGATVELADCAFGTDGSPVDAAFGAAISIKDATLVATGCTFAGASESGG